MCVNPQLGELVQFDAFISNIAVKCMVDTGATMSLVSAHILKCAKLVPSDDYPMRIQFGNKSVSKVNQSIQNVLYLPSGPVKSKLYVYDDLPYDVLLGLDFLCANNFIIRCSDQNEVEVSMIETDHVLPINAITTEPDIIKLRSSKQMLIPPRTTVKVQLTSDEPLFGTVHIDPELKSSVLQTSEALVSARNEQVITTISNPSSHVVRLEKGEVVASINFTQHVPYEKERQTGEPNINPDLNQKQRLDVDNLLLKLGKIFDSSKPGLIKGVHHRIILKDPNVQPIKCPPYRVSIAERKIMQQQIEFFVKAGHAAPSTSPWAFPVVLVKKKNGNYRVCVDYRKLNALTADTTSAYPLPKISDVLDSLRNCQWFSVFDCVSGYHQIAMHPDDAKLTAFVSPFGLHEFKVLPFGLQGAPATFQKAIDTILSSVKYEMALAYLDDIIVYAKDWEESMYRLETVLTLLMEAGVKLQPSKCYIAYTKIQYLGYVISGEGIQPDPEKVKAVSDFSIPKSLYHLRAFLGLTSYYRIFIQNYAMIAAPLYELLKGSTHFVWSTDCQKSFDDLKSALTSYPIVAHYRDTGALTVYTDASYDGIGAILTQEQEGEEKVISYLSRSLIPSEKNYTVSEIEALSIVFAVTRFRPYLFGHEFTVVTDHQALIYMFRNNEHIPRISRWILKLQEYRFSVKHRKGTQHTNADAISRMFNPQPENNSTQKINIIYTRELATLQENDTFCQQVKHKPDFEIDPDTKIIRRIIKTPYGEKKIIVLPKLLRYTVLQHLHDDHGHLSFNQTYALVRSRFHFNKKSRYVSQYIKTCPVCLHRNKPTQKPVGNLQPLPPVPLFTRLGIDFVGPIPLTRLKNQYLLVCTDYGSKWVEIAATKRADAHTAAEFLYHRIILRFGCFKELVSDLGSHFINELIQSLLHIFEIKHRKSTAYHPQTNGQTERCNKTIVNMLAKYAAENHNSWDEYVPLVQWFINTTPSASTGESPFRILHGYDPVLPIDLSIEGCDDPHFAASLRDSHEQIRKSVLEKIKASQARNVKEYNSRHRIVQYKPGDFVLLFRHSTPQGLSRKLLSRYQGPFVILRQIGANNYEVLDVRPTTKNAKPENVSVTRLKPCPLRYPPVQPSSGEEENSVEESKQEVILQSSSHEHDSVEIVVDDNENENDVDKGQTDQLSATESSVGEIVPERNLVEAIEDRAVPPTPPPRRSGRARKIPDRYKP